MEISLDDIIYTENWHVDYSLHQVQDAIKQAIARGDDIDAITKNALNNCALKKNQNLEIIKYLLNNYTILQENQKETFEHCISRSRDEIALYLCESIEDKFLDDEILFSLGLHNDTPHYLNLIQKLYQKGFKLMNDKHTLLERNFGSLPYSVDNVEYLLSIGFSFEDKNIDSTFRDITHFNRDSYQCKIDYLLAKNIDIGQNDSQLLKNAFNYNDNSPVIGELIAYILKKGVSPNTKNESIFNIIKDKDLKYIMLLDKYGLIYNKNDSNLLIRVCKADNLEVAQFLIEKGYDYQVLRNHAQGNIKQWCNALFHEELKQKIPEKNTRKEKSKL